MENEFEKLRREPVFPVKRISSLPGGYMGKILRVNLTERKLVEENLPEADVLRKYPGGQALGQLILTHELPGGITPLSPENILVFMTGPVMGTGRTPGSNCYTVTTFSNITYFGSQGKGAVTSGVAMGYWGSYLKFAGYDGIVINGASEEPVYLWINNGQVEIRDASGIWGKDTHETIDLIQQEVGQPKARVAAIGPAGEHMVNAAMILSDHNHSAAHGGGVVMGSKKLKAIAVYGDKKVPVKDGAKLSDAGKRWRGKIPPFEYPKSRHWSGLGTTLKTLVNRNFQSTLLPGSNQDFDKQEFIPRPCYACNRQCPYDINIKTGRHAGAIIHMNGGSEHFEGAAFTFGITGPEVFYLADVINRMGIEASHFGCAAGLVFEAYEKGLITDKETNGLELKWGDVGVVEEVIRRVARREGWLGNTIADGVKAAADKIGGEAQKLSVNIKGGAPAMHDWRPFTGTMLGQIISSGGVKPQFAAWDFPIEAPHSAPELGYPELTDRASPEGKGKEVLACGSNHLFCGAFGACWFGQPTARVGIIQDMVDTIAAITGWDDFTKEEAMMVGERAWQMEHMLHMRYGWTPEEDLNNVGDRWLEPLPDGDYKGFTIAKFLPEMVYDFYRECGWDINTGRPNQATLERLGMEEFSFLAKA
ncbi:aldehyde ferredoxin oxidoreductase family protein [Thermodesulfobacteriota bacterium]